MYTIEQLSRVIARWDAMLESGIHDKLITEDIEKLGKVTLARQLLDTMRQLEAVQARIDAARETVETKKTPP